MSKQSKRGLLTTEKLKQRFCEGPFELVNHAIKLAQNMVETGRAQDLQNPAENVLYQILSGKEQFLDPSEYQSRKETEVSREEIVKTVMNPSPTEK